MQQYTEKLRSALDELLHSYKEIGEHAGGDQKLVYRVEALLNQEPVSAPSVSEIASQYLKDYRQLCEYKHLLGEETDWTLEKIKGLNKVEILEALKGYQQIVKELDGMFYAVAEGAQEWEREAKEAKAAPVQSVEVKGPWHVKVETNTPHPESGEWAEENTFIITDGNTELTPENDLDEEAEQRIIDALNSAGCKISSDNAAYFNLRNDCDLLKEEIAEIKAAQSAGMQWVKGAPKERKECHGKVVDFIGDTIYDVILSPVPASEYWTATGANCYFGGIEDDRIIEHLLESSSLSTPPDCKEITGHNSIEEYRAYEEGYSAREKVTIEWIKKWDGSTNSGLGQLLMDKFRELSSPSTVKEQHTAMHEREVLARAFDKARELFQRRSWIMDGRGCYPYDDDRYKEEVRYLYDEFDALQKDTWANIITKSQEYRNWIIAEYLLKNGSKEQETAIAFAKWAQENYIKVFKTLTGEKWCELRPYGDAKFELTEGTPSEVYDLFIKSTKQ